MTRLRLGFIGTGTVGSALARALARAGYPVTALFNRTAEKAARLAASIEGACAFDSAQGVVDACDLVFLTVSDDSIEALCGSLSRPCGRGIEPSCGSIDSASKWAVVHCSGAASVDILRSARSQGAAVGVFHPLQTLARPEEAEDNLAGSAFGIEASAPELAATLSEIANALGGTPLAIAGEKAIYHASAVIASNYLVTLMDIAASLWSHLGLTREEGLRALLPLVRGTLTNLERIGLPTALTGPIARGDIGTLKKHLAALGDCDENLRLLYRTVGTRTVDLAVRKGTLTPDVAAELKRTLGESEHA